MRSWSSCSLPVLVLLAALLPLGCEDESQPAENRYAGSAAAGDLVTFNINETDHTYVVVNETTGQSQTGAYTVMSNELAGMYQIAGGGATFYAVELQKQILAANFPTGNPTNTISFGVSSDLDNTGKTAMIAGNYTYIVISNEPVNGSTDNKEWGVLSIDAGGTFKVRTLATGGTNDMTAMAPEEFSETLPLATGDVTGHWQVDGTKKERLAVTVDQEPGVTLTGFVYADADQTVFVLDRGTGHGFMLAFKLAPSSLAQVAGEYRFVNVWNDDLGAGRSAGKVAVAADGTGTLYHVDENNQISTAVLAGISQCPTLTNMFYVTTTETGHGATVHEKLYFVVNGRMFMAFGFRTDSGFRFASYAAGARL